MQSLPSLQDQHGAWTPPGVHLGYDSQHCEGVGFKCLRGAGRGGAGSDITVGTSPPLPRQPASAPGAPFVNMLIWVRWSLPRLALRAAPAS